MTLIAEIIKTDEALVEESIPSDVEDDEYDIAFGEDGYDEYDEFYEYEDVFYGTDYE
jgi:hypothetical protein